MRMRNYRCAGFTLLELILVVAILVVLSGIAVHSMEGLDQQTRDQETERRINDIELAVMGDPGLRQPDGSWIPNGFVNDMGALPGANLINDQLLGRPGPPPGIPRSQLQCLDGVRMVFGWRGSYLPIGTTDLRDGWGNPLRADDESNGLSVKAKGWTVSGEFEGDAPGAGTTYHQEERREFLTDDAMVRLSGVVQVLGSDGVQKPLEGASLKVYFPVQGQITGYSHPDRTSAEGQFDFGDDHRIPIGLRAIKITQGERRDIGWVKYVILRKGSPLIILITNAAHPFASCDGSPPNP